MLSWTNLQKFRAKTCLDFYKNWGQDKDLTWHGTRKDYQDGGNTLATPALPPEVIHQCIKYFNQPQLFCIAAALVVPSSLCWPCEPQASAVAQWDLPLGDEIAKKSVSKL